MKSTQLNNGFTLIELLIAVGIIGVLTGIAVPAYKGYISTSAGAVAGANIKTLRSFQENYRMEFNTYLAGTHPAGAASSILTTGLKWLPDEDKYTYSVTPGSTGDITTSLTVSATCDLCPAPVTTGN